MVWHSYFMYMIHYDLKYIWETTWLPSGLYIIFKWPPTKRNLCSGNTNFFFFVIMSSLSLRGFLEFEIESMKINKVWTLVETS
jgi:hypothetical protein